jgi:hypothetical protein
VSLAVLLLSAACPAAAPLPEGDAYVRGLLSAQHQREEALSRYSYDVHELREELDRAGVARKRRTRDFEVFVVKGRPVRRLVAENGRPLAGRAREKEERRVRELAEAIASGRAVSERPGVRIAQLLERYSFVAARREEIRGRCSIVFDFTARPGDSALEHDTVLRRLAGRLWVDEADRAVVKVELRNTSGIKLALGIGASVSTLSLRTEFVRLEDGVWLPRSVETLAVGRKLLLRRFRVRTTTSYARYRRFEVEVKEEVSEAPEPPGRMW